jgi:hypothetical protein
MQRTMLSQANDMETVYRGPGTNAARFMALQLALVMVTDAIARFLGLKQPY